jgi:hypothetical protein
MPIVDAETIRRKLEKLEAVVEALRSAQKTAVDERIAIVGKAVLEYAAADPAYAAELTRLLDSRLTRKRDRILCGLPVTQRHRKRREAAGDAGAAMETTAPVGESPAPDSAALAEQPVISGSEPTGIGTV